MRKIFGIVLAHLLESRKLRTKFESVASKKIAQDEFLLDGTVIKFVISGVGEEKIKSTVCSLFQKGRQPSILLNIGFVGALDSKLNWGDWILCNKIYHFNKDFSGEDFFTAESNMLEEARKFFSNRKFSFQVGSLVTATGACSNPESKMQLSKMTKTLAVDMEAYFIAKVAVENNVSFLALKIVSDAVHESAGDAIKSRGSELSNRIGEVIPDFITMLVS